ncbi:MAG: helix-turn-helix domain-containing protein [Bacteroidota bacterium]
MKTQGKDISNNSKRQWMYQLNKALSEHIADATLNNQRLAEIFELSERHLSRKVKEFTGLSPQRYLRQHRLKRAMNYLRYGKYKTVGETARAIGYVNTSYFIQQFEKQFGKRPFTILKESGWR